MPRHKRYDRPVHKKIHLPESVVEQVDASLRDPLTDATRFGGWQELVQELLEQWLDGRIQIHLKPFRINLDNLMEPTCAAVPVSSSAPSSQPSSTPFSSDAPKP